ncbi:MAG: phosphate ABC transporter ATP-binding protein [Thermoplasmata archaeon]|nr:phosphate ABC transporter ATP-binding protein [Thermoplasmata archaeon]
MVTFKPHIQVRNLTVHYGKHCALKNVTFDLPDKQLTVIIGPSGCGKTTLLKCFNRLIDLVDDVRVEGKVLVDGEDIFDPKADITSIRKKMGLLFQRPYPLPMSIYENVAYGPRIHGERDPDRLDEIVEDHLRQAGIWEEVKDRLDAPAWKLSIGQQQRLCLARGLAVEPEAILADEPTSALDPVSAKKIEEKLLALKKELTVVVVTHNLRRAKRLGDYAAFIYLGDLVEFGPVNEVLESPRDSRTRAYVTGEI